ncbi:histidine kinase [Lipingzhangella sp. LS1_29]|uniref:histidine kinase n=1 Tax=Lipingzhangella rawalii TaxID=2055835 RepID=A0ABU2HB69_9ACTN|nr:histidine kinase [Lipingzhangella rawalii]MDS1272533.1 histidine kinase [Lipingzhangella rawalii]
MRLLRGLDPEIWRGAVTPLAEPRPRRWILRDLLLWLGLSGFGVSGVLSQYWEQGGLAVTAWALGVLCVTAFLVALSRPLPLLALASSVLATLVTPALTPAMGVMAYLVGRRMPRIVTMLALLELVIMTGLVYLLWFGVLDLEVLSVLLMVLLFVLVPPWLVGVYRRQQKQLADAGWEHAKQLEREQWIVGEQMRVRERSRIAQDMHDSLGHELSLIALRAGALEMATDLAQQHRQSAGELRAHATAATERLQEIIGVLRERQDPLPLDPVGEGVSALVERVRSSGVDVALERVGPAAALPDMVDRAVYRVVQEALTNATKHAPGASVLVQIVHDVDETTVSVYNDAGTADPLPGATQGRRGLAALAERVRVAGGTFDAGEERDGFRVTARFGHRSAPVDATGTPEPAGASVDLEGSAVGAEMRHAQLRSRRAGILVASAFAVVTVGGLVVVSGIQLSALDQATLPTEDFDRIEVGQPRGEVEEELPVRDLVTEADRDSASPPPDGAICSYYHAAPVGEVQLPGGEVYRLCYVDDILVAKDRIGQ